MGVATVQVPINDLTLEFDVHIVNADVQILLSID